MCNNQVNTNKTPFRKLKFKIYEERKTVITELSETKHFVTIKCAIYAVLFGFVGYDMFCGLVLGRNVDYGFRLIRIGFAKFDLVVLIWSGLFCIYVIVFYLFKQWANIRFSLTPRSLVLKLWDYSFLLSILLYYIGVFITVPIFIKVFELGTVSSCIILMEQVRILMKAYSFIRVSIPEVKNYKPHSDRQPSGQNLKHYLYFFFAPAAIYRREYPRTKYVDKGYVVQCFVEFFAMLWLQSFLIDRCFVRKFENTGLQKIDWAVVLAIIMQNLVGAFAILIVTFYQILDRWLSGWAELLRFADRRFYEDWWTSTNYSTYFRKWNMVVQDWLFEYIYKEFYEHIVPENRKLAKFMVFLISAIFHEYILIFMLDEFFPLLFFNFFVLGQFLTNYYIDSNHPFFNMVMLYTLALGPGLQFSLYTMELYARKHCFDDTAWSYFKPRILTSECVL